jgi:hypothetical protein
MTIVIGLPSGELQLKSSLLPNNFYGVFAKPCGLFLKLTRICAKKTNGSLILTMAVFLKL